MAGVCRLRTAVIFGGVSQHHQVKALKAGVDILIATPGRLLDLCNQRHVRLDKVSILVLDEADRMLDMGFIHDVRKIVSLLQTRAADPAVLGDHAAAPIAKLAQDILVDPVRVDIAPAKVAVDRIDQRVYSSSAPRRSGRCSKACSPIAAWIACWSSPAPSAAPIASAAISRQAGFAADALHGNKAQNARVRALETFRSGKVRILVATDIAARGIDVPIISHVINYELPNEPESYVHRIGRTARAGAEGAALSFCDQSERPYLQAIERLMRSSVSVGEHRLAVTPAAVPAPHKPTAARQGARARAGQAAQAIQWPGASAGLPRTAQPSSRGERALPLRGDLR